MKSLSEGVKFGWRFFVLLCFIISAGSCVKERIEPSQSDQDYLFRDASFKISAIEYDNFYDDMDWPFTDFPAIPRRVGAWTSCGNSANGRWGRISWKWSCPLYPSLASTSDGYLTLQVPGDLQKKGAQLESTSEGYWYGSYRAKIKAGVQSGNLSGTNPQGSCNAFFFYNSAGEEIDVEILTTEHLENKVRFVVHPGAFTQTFILPSDPTSTFIEYGFDWYANRIDFFVDGEKVPGNGLLQTVPSEKGSIILNHWTGSAAWGGNPPPDVSNMMVDFVWHSPFILVTYPDAAGKAWTMGSSRIITWKSYGDVASYPVNIELWKGGSFYSTIKNGAANNGTYSWVVPTRIIAAADYQIKIRSTLNSDYFDFSNKPLAIISMDEALDSRDPGQR